VTLTDTWVAEEVPLSDDRALVAQSAQGNTAAFAELLKRHDDKMRGVVWRLVGSPTEMDDILQDAYLKAWRGLESFQGTAAFSSWLYRIVYTTTLDYLKSAARRRVVPLDDASLATVEDSSTALAESLALREALATLPADQLAVVTLVDGQGQSYEAVASMLDISPGTVASRLSRARASLRKELTSTNATNEGDKP